MVVSFWVLWVVWSVWIYTKIAPHFFDQRKWPTADCRSTFLTLALQWTRMSQKMKCSWLRVCSNRSCGKELEDGVQIMSEKWNGCDVKGNHLYLGTLHFSKYLLPSPCTVLDPHCYPLALTNGLLRRKKISCMVECEHMSVSNKLTYSDSSGKSPTVKLSIISTNSTKDW